MGDNPDIESGWAGRAWKIRPGVWLAHCAAHSKCATHYCGTLTEPHADSLSHTTVAHTQCATHSLCHTQSVPHHFGTLLWLAASTGPRNNWLARPRPPRASEKTYLLSRSQHISFLDLNIFLFDIQTYLLSLDLNIFLFEISTYLLFRSKYISLWDPFRF